MDFETLNAAKSFTKKSLVGMGAVKGASCQVAGTRFDEDGNTVVTLSWKDNNGATKTQDVTIKKGADGKDGIDGINGIDGKDGDKGEQGEKGVGIESIIKKATVGLVDTYLIVFNDGTETTFDVVNGANITKTSQLENDSNFITNATIGLINYYLKDEVYSKSKIDELLRNIGAGLSVRIVPTLPTEEISGTTIYLINTSGSNFNQYMFIDGDWASLGSTSVDLSSYYNKTQIDTMLLGYITASTLLSQLMQYAKLSDLSKVAKSNDYNDLDNLPEIPDVSGIKPYTSSLQDSENTAPTSKALFDAVQTINSEVEKKADSDDIPTKVTDLEDADDYMKQSDFDDYKGEVQDKFDEVNVNLGVLEESKADKTEVNNMLAKYPNAKYYNTIESQKLDCNDIVDRVCLVTASFTGSDALHYPAKELLFIFTTKNSSGDGMQKAISWNTQREWNRVMQNGTWSAWQELATMDKLAHIHQRIYANSHNANITDLNLTQGIYNLVGINRKGMFTMTYRCDGINFSYVKNENGINVLGVDINAIYVDDKLDWLLVDKIDN